MSMNTCSSRYKETGRNQIQCIWR